MSLYDGVESYADYVRISPEHSLVAQGFVGKPTAPMLVIAGALDTQVPISDVELWLRSGNTPKEAWIHGGAVTWDAMRSRGAIRSSSPGSPRLGSYAVSLKRKARRLERSNPAARQRRSSELFPVMADARRSQNGVPRRARTAHAYPLAGLVPAEVREALAASHVARSR